MSPKNKPDPHGWPSGPDWRLRTEHGYYTEMARLMSGPVDVVLNEDYKGFRRVDIYGGRFTQKDIPILHDILNFLERKPCQKTG